MNGYNFTERVRKVLSMARETAAELRCEYVAPAHIAIALLEEGQSVAAVALRNLGVDIAQLAVRIRSTVEPGKHATGPDLPYTSRAKKCLELSMATARELNHTYVGCEHLLLGILRLGNSAGAVKEFADAGVTYDNALEQILMLLGTERPPEPIAPRPRRVPVGVQSVTLVIDYGLPGVSAFKFPNPQEAARFLQSLD